MSIFEDYFSSVYQGRWPGLLEALSQDKRKVSVLNPFIHPSVKPLESIIDQRDAKELDVEGHPKLDCYNIDKASLEVVKALNIQENMKIADFCAAPGGKALMSLFALMGEGLWTLNELSDPRFRRLKRVMSEQLPDRILQRVTIYKGNAETWGKSYKQTFDRIILDVPCSGERYLLKKPAELKTWTLKRSKRLAQRQFSLLCSAFDSLAIDGQLVYSTCSINPVENDDVIEKLFKKRKQQFEVVPLCETLMGEPTKYGNLILPDCADGYGPIYYSVIKKSQ